MNKRSLRIVMGAGMAALLGVSAAAAQPLVQPGAPGQPNKTLTPAQSAAMAHSLRSEADVKFMQGMIGHHAQAVEMVALLNKNTQRPDMKLMGQRISISQTDEIKFMQTWLTRRGESLPDAHMMHDMPGMTMTGMAMMPGMLTPAQMTALAAARGPAFDRLFLTGMIQHHEGALTMVHELMAQPGAGEDSDLFDFTSGVVADQSAEIARMDGMLGAMSRAASTN